MYKAHIDLGKGKSVILIDMWFWIPWIFNTFGSTHQIKYSRNLPFSSKFFDVPPAAVQKNSACGSALVLTISLIGRPRYAATLDSQMNDAVFVLCHILLCMYNSMRIDCLVYGSANPRRFKLGVIWEAIRPRNSVSDHMDRLNYPGCPRVFFVVLFCDRSFAAHCQHCRHKSNQKQKNPLAPRVRLNMTMETITHSTI